VLTFGIAGADPARDLHRGSVALLEVFHPRHVMGALSW
jgi:hypothetical protein